MERRPVVPTGTQRCTSPLVFPQHPEQRGQEPRERTTEWPRTPLFSMNYTERPVS